MPKAARVPAGSQSACENVQAFRELMERLEGKVVFPIETKEPIAIHWVIGKGYVTKEEFEQLEAPHQLGPVETSGDSRGSA
jgi:hypothetical protein